MSTEKNTSKSRRLFELFPILIFSPPRLNKGCGYHLDLLVLAIIVVISSVFGLPWFIANTIPSINHIQSLIKESSTSIPGEKPQFLGVREQRLTSLMIAILTGFSVLMTPILALIPMPVLYGVFLFMGVMALRGLQFFDRILLLFMPTKYQPNYVFLKFVQLSRVHLFTIIQMVTMGVLWGIKSNTRHFILTIILKYFLVGGRWVVCWQTKIRGRKFNWNWSFLRACQFLPELCKNIFFRTAIAFPVMVSFLYIELLLITGPLY